MYLPQPGSPSFCPKLACINSFYIDSISEKKTKEDQENSRNEQLNVYKENVSRVFKLTGICTGLFFIVHTIQESTLFRETIEVKGK
jgi:hypothetical protein